MSPQIPKLLLSFFFPRSSARRWRWRGCEHLSGLRVFYLRLLLLQHRILLCNTTRQFISFDTFVLFPSSFVLRSSSYTCASLRSSSYTCASTKPRHYAKRVCVRSKLAHHVNDRKNKPPRPVASLHSPPPHTHTLFLPCSSSVRETARRPRVQRVDLRCPPLDVTVP